MKTAEEWASTIDMNIWSNADATTIKQIQLDAMKEGMRRAAKVEPKMEPHHSDEHWQGITMKEQAILSEAEQLTEKDL